jgi:hypothetical protein
MSELLFEVNNASVHQDARHTYIEGNFLNCGTTSNKRHYSENVLDEAVANYMGKISSQSAYGHLGHTGTTQSNPQTVSHLITSLTKRGKNYYGRARVLDTPSGNILHNILKAGGKIGMSSASLGSVKKRQDGLLEVESPLRLLHVDAVLDAASANTHVRALTESLCEAVLADQQKTPAAMTRHPSVHSHILDLITQLGHPEIINAQRNAIDVDTGIAQYIAPSNNMTWLEIMEKDKEEVLRALAILQTKLKGYNLQNSDFVSHLYGNYAKALRDNTRAYQRTNEYPGAGRNVDVIRHNQIRRECASMAYGARIINETIKMLSRAGRSSTRLSDPQPDTLIESIRRKAGSGLVEYKDKIKE